MIRFVQYFEQKFPEHEHLSLTEDEEERANMINKMTINYDCSIFVAKYALQTVNYESIEAALVVIYGDPNDQNSTG